MTMKETFEKNYPSENVAMWKHIESGMDQYVILEDKEVRLINICARIAKLKQDSSDFYHRLYNSLEQRTGLRLDPLQKEFELKELIGYGFDHNKE
jgi:hypothetical protein